MKKYKIVKNIASLREKSEPVSTVEEANVILSKLSKALDNESNGLGLAAVQIGIPKQIGIMTKKDGTKVNLINPEIIETKDEFVFVKEGCLSFPNRYIDTKRFRQVIIKNSVIDGDGFREETQYYYYQPGETNSDDLLCIQVQHEIDHFNGVLYQDHETKDNTVIAMKADPKIGRNDKCPCGSNKKYKKCCMP